MPFFFDMHKHGVAIWGSNIAENTPPLPFLLNNSGRNSNANLIAVPFAGPGLVTSSGAVQLHLRASATDKVTSIASPVHLTAFSNRLNAGVLQGLIQFSHILIEAKLGEEQLLVVDIAWSLLRH
jgi:hypothetical protein